MRWLIFFVFYWPLELLAQSGESGATVIDPVSPTYMMKLTGGLLLVVAIIFTIAWMLKRLNLTQQSQGGALRIVAGLSVGTRDRIVLVQVGDEQILVGLSPGRMEKLHALSQPIPVDENVNTMPPFAQKLNELMGKGSNK